MSKKTNSPASSRQAIRREMRKRRRSLSPHEQREAAQQLRRIMGRRPLFHRSRHIAFYLPNDGEIDPRPLMELASLRGKRCYLPVLHPGREGALWFLPWRPGDELKPNRFGIPEPVMGNGRRRPAQALDLVLLPVVAFDRQGGRLGMGAGFYDRTFAFKSRLSAAGRSCSTPLLMGLAHSCQEAPALPVERWDVPLAAIATEKGVIEVKGAVGRQDLE